MREQQDEDEATCTEYQLTGSFVSVGTLLGLTAAFIAGSEISEWWALVPLTVLAVEWHGAYSLTVGVVRRDPEPAEPPDPNEPLP